MHDYINNLKKNTPIDSELYFRSLQNNTMTFDAFKESQTNFYGAVCYFSRPLFSLCSRIDNYVDRLTILENIFDEHGNGNINEDRYTEISSFIAKTIVRKNWLDESKLSHYSIHKDLDIHHAELFYKLIEQKWSNKQSMQYIKTGLDLGNKLVLKLFNEILIKTSKAD